MHRVHKPALSGTNYFWLILHVRRIVKSHKIVPLKQITRFFIFVAYMASAAVRWHRTLSRSSRFNPEERFPSHTEQWPYCLNAEGKLRSSVASNRDPTVCDPAQSVPGVTKWMSLGTKESFRDLRSAYVIGINEESVLVRNVLNFQNNSCIQ